MEPSQLLKEEKFHDDWAETIDIRDVLVDECFEACTSPENRLILAKLGDLRGKKILDVGSGAGEAAVYLAKQGAEVTATDLSAGMLKVVEQVARHHGVTVATRQSTADRLDFPAASFDIVYAANLLHHVNLESTLAEVRRVLKPAGVFASWDPLAHNPLINIYRKIARDVRTDDEHPLKMSDLDTFKKYFSLVEHQTTWLMTLWIFIRFYLIDRIDPNRERYWKRIIKEHALLSRSYKRLASIDKFLLTKLPFLQRYCWNIVVLARK